VVSTTGYGTYFYIKVLKGRHPVHPMVISISDKTVKNVISRTCQKKEDTFTGARAACPDGLSMVKKATK
jgi:hypothetical protein